jgi:hypothetical protein
MPSPEETMAYFATLSAGKEAELQAQAEAEAEERMASIMGRKPEAKPEAAAPPPVQMEAPPAPPVPVEVPEPPQVEAPKPPVEVQPAWLTGEGAMPSAEEAMAFFAKLSAGKEAELQAQAQAEAEERMASIMGRKLEGAPATLPPTPVREPQPVEEAPAIPEWPTEPEIELAPEALVEAAPVPEVPTGWAAWAEAQAAEEAMPAAEPEPIEGLVAGWPATEITTGPAIEPAPVEAVPIARVPVVEAAGPDWWYQTLADEEVSAESPGRASCSVSRSYLVAVLMPKEPVSAPVALGAMLPPSPVAPVEPTLALPPSLPAAAAKRARTACICRATQAGRGYGKHRFSLRVNG